MRAFFVRHGQSEQNATNLRSRLNIETFRAMLEASYDSPLTILGRQQAQATAEQLITEGITHLYASPFLRAQQTASIISDIVEIPIITIPTLHEVLPLVPPVIRNKAQRSLGSTYIRGYLHLFWPQRPIQGETLWNARQRIATTWTTISQEWRPSSSAVIVAHRAFIWMTLRHLERNTSWKIVRRNLNNAGISEVRMD